MRIISKYKDYYDNAQIYGIDTTQIFVRNEELVLTEKVHQFQSTGYHAEKFTIYGLPNHKLNINYFVVGFCGYLYIGCQFTVSKNDIIIEAQTFYHFNRVHKYFKKLIVKYPIEINYRNPTTKEVFRRINVTLNRHKELKSVAAINDYFVKFNTPTFVFHIKSYLPERYLQFRTTNYLNTKIQIVKNPILKKLDFYRAVTPVECFQKINQYRFGVLTELNQKTSKQTNIEKVRSHGFDAKYGFRTRPKRK